MHAFLLVTLSFFGQTSPSDGSLVFLEKCNYFVERYTNASIGHVAIAVQEDDQTWIYEATPGKVRRLSWPDYRAELGVLNADRVRKEKETIVTWVYEPQEPLSEKESAALRRYLDSQLNRRYSVHGIVRGKEGDGIHCAELAAHALNEVGRGPISDCHQQSPAAVMELAKSYSARPYQAQIDLPEEEEPWCSRAWRKTVHWARMCSWSCGEAWRYCW